MVHLSRFRLIFFAFLIQLSMPHALLCMEFELFSFSYNKDNDLKLNVLNRTVYDPEQAKKDAEEIKNIEELDKKINEEFNETQQKQRIMHQESNEINQKIKILDQQINHIDSSIEQVNKSIALKKAALQKALEEL